MWIVRLALNRPYTFVVLALLLFLAAPLVLLRAPVDIFPEINIPVVESMADFARKPDFTDSESHVWHYGHTDPNRHVNGTAYLRAMEEFLADSLKRAGHDLARLYFARTRVVYRKPCFRGEGYRRAAWFRSEAPLTLTGAFIKEGEPTGSPTTAAGSCTLSRASSSRCRG